ncbi:DciA family protein [Kitasatospora sp. NPDC015120]|uniref:DciA family protein n=1 Tax=Kitasatospora sp. NPDC015120 TaxID=3364023 RepID=UPI0036F4733F
MAPAPATGADLAHSALRAARQAARTAAHWHLASYDPTTRRLRVLADSPAWAAQLRYQTRHILTALDQLRPGTVVQ